MADLNWRQQVIADWEAAEDVVNAALVAAGLAPLNKWIKGEPRPYPQTGGPLLWWDWPDEGADEVSEVLDNQREQVAMLAVLLIEAPDVATLMDREAEYLPVVIAALERHEWTYQTTYRGGGRLTNPRGMVAWRPMAFQIEADRLIGDVR